MKRILVLVFALLMVFSALASEQIDIAGMSDEELLATKIVVDDEIEIRGIDDLEPFYLGTYIGGKSIKAGEYYTILVFDEGYITVSEYESEDALKNDDYYNYDTLFHGTSSYHFSISDGQVVTFESAYPVKMAIKNTNPSWAP